MQGLTLEVLEKLAKTYEEMQKTNEELKNSLKIIKEALTKPSTMTETKSGWASDTTSRTPPNDRLVAQSNGTAQTTKSVPTTTAETTTTPESQTDLKQLEASDSEDNEVQGESKSAVQKNKKA